MKQRYDRKRTNKKWPKWLTSIWAVLVVALVGVVVWVSANDWDINKTMEQAGLKSTSTKTQAVEQESLSETQDEEEDAALESEEQKPLLEEVKPTPPEEPMEAEKEAEATPFDGGYIEGQELPTKPTYVENILIANKENPLPETFAPGEDKTARAAFEKMAVDASLSGFNLTAFSTYRSYDYQVSLYNRYVDRDGAEAADRYSARPGYSEHQTGLAFDIGEVNHEKHWASQSFGETEAGKWVLANAHRFGFILRYPNHKENITGYMYEAWHFRYVGTPLSEEIFKKNITLEEYVGLK